MRANVAIGLSLGAVIGGALSAPARATPIIYDGNEYFLTATPGTWAQAEQQAESDGGHLVSIHSAADNQFIIDTFLSGANSRSVLWVGLYDPTENDGNGAQHAADFVWSDGSPVNYTNWNTATGEPNNSQNMEYWTAINWHYAASGSGTVGTWNDLPIDGSDAYSVTVNGPYYGIVEVAAVEPRGIGLFALGLVGVGVTRRRRPSR